MNGNTLLPNFPIGFIILKPNQLPRTTKTGGSTSSKLYQSPRQALRFAQPGDTIHSISLTDCKLILTKEQDNG